MGVFANWMTVRLMVSSGRECMSADRMNHCRPAVRQMARDISEDRLTQEHRRYLPFPRKIWATLSCWAR